MENAQMPEQRVIDPDKWKPGKYTAKAVDWGVSKTKEGLPQVIVLFEYAQTGSLGANPETRQLMFFGSFKGGAKERTLETLLNLGLRGPVVSLETGRDGKALDHEQEVEIVVEHRVFNDQKRAGIAWVNKLGGRGIQQKLDSNEAKTLFSDLDNEFLATLAAKGLKPKVTLAVCGGTKTIAQKVQEQGTLGEGDIPF